MKMKVDMKEVQAKLSAVQKKLADFDWRSLKKYTSPKAADDLNAFLEALPQHTGQNILIIAAIIWMAAGAIGLYTTVQIQKLSELRVQLQEAEALRPTVPTIKDVQVSGQEVSKFAEKITQIYQGLSIRANGSKITIEAESTGQFGQFREAIGYSVTGGNLWRVGLDRLCVGRECGQKPLSMTLNINRVTVE